MASKNSNVIPFNPAARFGYRADEERGNNIIGERISALRKEAGLSLAEFSDYLRGFGVDVMTGAISKWERGLSSPNAYQLIAVCFALGVTDVLDEFTSVAKSKPLLNKEGQRKVEEYTKVLIASGLYAPETIEADETEYIEMRVSELPVSAGTGALLSEENFKLKRFPKEFVPDGADFGLRVSGDSMEPVFHDGQLVWIEECEEIAPSEIGIFFYDGCGYMKQYDEREPDAEQREAFTDSYGVVHPQPVLISYNEEYAPIFVSPSAEFQIAGRVLR